MFSTIDHVCVCVHVFVCMCAHTYVACMCLYMCMCLYVSDMNIEINFLGEQSRLMLVVKNSQGQVGKCKKEYTQHIIYMHKTKRYI